MTPTLLFPFCRDDHHDSLIYAMSSIMINILNESEEAPQQLLEVILRNLIKRKKVRAPFVFCFIFLSLVYIFYFQIFCS